MKSEDILHETKKKQSFIVTKKENSIFEHFSSPGNDHQIIKTIQKPHKKKHSKSRSTDVVTTMQKKKLAHHKSQIYISFKFYSEFSI